MNHFAAGLRTILMAFALCGVILITLLTASARAQSADSEENHSIDLTRSDLPLGDDPCSQPFEVVLSALKSENHVARWAATECLETTKDRRATEPLVEALLTDDGDVKLSLLQCKALRSIDDPRTADLLLDALNVPATRWEAAYSLGQVKITRGLQPLLEMLSSENSQDRTIAANALGAMQDPRAINPLIAVLNGEDIIMRRYAAIALGRIGDGRASPALIAALNDSDDGVRSDAVEALGRIRSTAAVPALAQLLAEPQEDRDVVRISANSLGEIADTSAVSALIGGLYSGRRDAQWYSAEALASIENPQATQALIAGLRRGNLKIVGGAYWKFIRMGDESFVPALVAALKADGDVSMARDYACSGNAKLAEAAHASPFADQLFGPDDGDLCVPTWGSQR